MGIQSTENLDLRNYLLTCAWIVHSIVLIKILCAGSSAESIERNPGVFLGGKEVKDNLYEKAKSEVLLAAYFAKELIEELGRDKALEIIGRAYQKYSNDTFSEPYLNVPLEERFQRFKTALKAEAEQGRHFTVVGESDTHIQVRFHRCPYYEVYSDYGIPEVCQKYCDGDYEAFRIVHPRLRVMREHEIAYGDGFCDHCWTLEE
jgi:predicted ArsR family transcriptional regulator